MQIAAALVAACLAAVGAWGADKAKGKADADTVKMVEYFTTHEIGELPSGRIPAFLAVDESTLPKKLQMPFLARREELLTLKKIADGKNRPLLRRLGKDAARPDECMPSDDPKMARVLKLAGMDEISEDEALHLVSDTNCNECELMIEFSLRKVIDPKHKPKAKGEKPRYLYFLNQKDPLWNLVGAYRAGKSAFGTNFFGSMKPTCH
ncbi:MAG: hypothetical protein HY078_06995 [Elusimicrobia bacterium]|nr:hypothetical protein [Elusimicrobiota bacterium]